MFQTRALLQIILILFATCAVQEIECAVLDPALYLSPSPPVKSSSIKQTLWSTPTNLSEVKVDNEITVIRGRTFWPKIRTDYSLGGIHIPLSYSLSGSYGSQGADGTSVIGTSYVDISGLTSTKTITGNSKPSMLRAQYDVFNTGPSVVRIYGGNNKPAWSGWGNGKWGHYGKG